MKGMLLIAALRALAPLSLQAPKVKCVHAPVPASGVHKQELRFAKPESWRPSYYAPVSFAPATDDSTIAIRMRDILDLVPKGEAQTFLNDFFTILLEAVNNPDCSHDTDSLASAYSALIEQVFKKAYTPGLMVVSADFLVQSYLPALHSACFKNRHDYLHFKGAVEALIGVFGLQEYFAAELVLKFYIDCGDGSENKMIFALLECWPDLIRQAEGLVLKKIADLHLRIRSGRYYRFGDRDRLEAAEELLRKIRGSFGAGSML